MAAAAAAQADARGAPKASRLRRCNSTSSLYVSSAIGNPSLEELLVSVATMLHCQMVRDESASPEKKAQFPFFMEEKYTGKVNKAIPDIDRIFEFLKKVFEVGEFRPECSVILLVYINRLIGLVDMPLTASNWKPVTIIALVIAQKVWDDNPLANADFAILYPVLNVRQINDLEVKFLLLLQYKLTVPGSLYARYFFELRTICERDPAAYARPIAASEAFKLDRDVAAPKPPPRQRRKSVCPLPSLAADGEETRAPAKRLVLS